MSEIELQIELAKMLPEKLAHNGIDVWWCGSNQYGAVTKESWLHVCWLIERELSNYCGENGEHDSQREQFALALLKQVATWPDNFRWGSECEADFYKVANASWQQRAAALIAVKGGKNE